MDFRAACLLVLLSGSQVAGQQHSAPLAPPFGPANRLVSPDRAHTLFGDDKEAQLWLEDTRTRQRRMVLKVTVQTLTLAWSPDSAAFIANDRETSDFEAAYIYDVRTLSRLDLRNRVLAADPRTAPFVPGPNTSSHSYVHGIRWLNAHEVEVRFYGHTDAAPVRCFEFRYRISRDGGVAKRSERVAPVTDSGCPWEE